MLKPVLIGLEKFNKALEKVLGKSIYAGSPSASPLSTVLGLEVDDRLLGGNGVVTSLITGRDYNPNILARGIMHGDKKIRNILDSFSLERAQKRNDSQAIKDITKRIESRIKDFKKKQKKWDSLYKL